MCTFNFCLFYLQIFAYVALLFVLLSIFSYLAETTEHFHHYITVRDHSNTTETVQNTRNLTETSTSNTRNTQTTTEMFTTTEHQGEDEPQQIRIEHPLLYIIDVTCFTYFIVEYIARVIFSPNKLKYATSLFAIIDLLALLPDIIEFSVYRAPVDAGGDVVGFITIIRIVRVLRVFRLVRHSAGLWILVYTLRASFNELILLVWFMSLGILVFSSLIYYVDDREQFTSIPTAFWWALITMTTVGYGDMYPTTTLGKMVGSLCAMAGVLMIGFTVPALVNNFMLYYRHVQYGMTTDKAAHVNKLESKSKKRTKEFEMKELKTIKIKKNESPELKKKESPELKRERKQLVTKNGAN